jgi:SAM-dependent methyltransferase
MGLGIAAIQNTLELWKTGLFSDVKKVIEMGSQEIHMKALDFEEMVHMFGVDGYNKENFKYIDNWPSQPRESAIHFYEMLGVEEYYSIDLNQQLNAIAHDYNLPFEDDSLIGKFDLVTDHGACEHAFNVTEAYRTMHKLLKSGGYMIIAQSLWGGNGYYLYDKHFFEGIAAANGYKIIHFSYVINTGTKTENGSYHQFHIPASRELLRLIDLRNTPAIGVYCVLQKQTDAEFNFPYQDNYMSEKQGHMGFNRVFFHDPMGYSYIPAQSMSARSGKYHMRNLLKKIKFYLRRAIEKC